jgi:hypothetical protein
MDSCRRDSVAEIGVVMQTLEFEVGTARECYSLQELAELTRRVSSDGTYMVWLDGGQWFFEPVSWNVGYSVAVSNEEILFADSEWTPSVEFFEERLMNTASSIWYNQKLRFLGIWHDNDTNGGVEICLDGVVNIFEKDKALTVASVLEEDAIWDNRNKVAIYVEEPARLA